MLWSPLQKLLVVSTDTHKETRPGFYARFSLEALLYDKTIKNHWLGKVKREDDILEWPRRRDMHSTPVSALWFCGFYFAFHLMTM